MSKEHGFKRCGRCKEIFVFTPQINELRDKLDFFYFFRVANTTITVGRIIIFIFESTVSLSCQGTLHFLPVVLLLLI
jgi:hypothetical protein